jgi:DNA polymerase-3 subunit epsilon
MSYLKETVPTNLIAKLSNSYTKPVLFLDFETTAREYKLARIVSVYMVLVHKGKIIGELDTLINPGPGICIENSDIHGITDDMVKNAPQIEFVIDLIYTMFSKASIVVGYNITSYDLPLLAYNVLGTLYSTGFSPSNQFYEPFKDKLRIFDLYYYIKKYKVREDMSSRTLSKMYEALIGKELDGAHGAKADVLACGEILKALGIKYTDLKLKSLRINSMASWQLEVDEPFEATAGIYTGKEVCLKEMDPGYLKFMLSKELFTVKQ